MIARKYVSLTLAVYAVLVAVWCLIAPSIGNLPFVLERVAQSGHWIVPLVMMGLGFYVLAS